MRSVSVSLCMRAWLHGCMNQRTGSPWHDQCQAMFKATHGYVVVLLEVETRQACQVPCARRSTNRIQLRTEETHHL